MGEGEEEADKAKAAAEGAFGGSGDMSNLPTTEISKEELGIRLIDFLAEKKVLKNKSEGRRLIEQNGMSINDEKVKDIAFAITEDLFNDGELIVRMGKKRFNRVIIK